MQTTFTPVPYEAREAIEESIQTKKEGKIFFFNDENALDDAHGPILAVNEDGGGTFIRTSDDKRIRIDRIITLFGKPGAAYDEYDAYGNVCFECTGGYPI